MFSSQSGGALNVWWKAPNETASAERLTTSANNQWPTSVSSDGKQVVLTELTPTLGRDLMLLALDGSQRVTPLLQTPFDEQRGIISPDGHWLATLAFPVLIQLLVEARLKCDCRRPAGG